MTVRAAASESAGITFEDVARLALRRACLVSRFNPLTQMRMLWLRKRRRQRRRRRLRSRRRSKFVSPGGASLRPGTRCGAIREAASMARLFYWADLLSGVFFVIVFLVSPAPFSCILPSSLPWIFDPFDSRFFEENSTRGQPSRSCARRYEAGRQDTRFNPE